ncbi:MAG: GNAT family N-acetyltransferase [Muribaculaceae bacterium]|nr:GNAT family N-acetyltransferase [Muribaculaceae bacterium]
MTELRQITDIGDLMRWRREVIETVFSLEPDDALMAENEDYYRKHLADGSHLAFVAMKDGEETGCGSVCLTDELPSPDNPTGRCAYLMNIYVRAAYREQGLGHTIVKKLVEEAKRRDCHKIYLETTSIGRSLYESLGFRDLPDMMKLAE